MSETPMKTLVEPRRSLGIERLDERWEGVWRLADSTRDHQRVAGLEYAQRAGKLEVRDPQSGRAWSA
jgi:hypothetical protein